MEKVQIIILAAGKSRRMRSDEPKALAMLKKKPFLQHILDTIAKLNLKIKPIIVVGHKKERIFEVIGNDQKYAHQEEQLGTGHAVQSARHIADKEHEIVVVLSTDQPLISTETIERIIATQKNKKPTMTIGTVILPDFDDWRAGLMHFGRILRDENGQVLMNVEFRDATDEEKKITEVNPALYAFDAPWLWENLKELKNNNSQNEYYLTDLVKIARKQGRKIETVPVVNLIEGLQPNTREELEALENFMLQ